jgi:DNA-binding MarR family transcriptional regulator
MAHLAQKPSRKAAAPSNAEAGTLLGRDFIAAVVVFHELVGRCLGVSATDRKCLDLLSRGPVTAGELARFTGLTTGAVTGMIDRLVEAGYAERISDPNDRRRVLVSRKPHSRLDKILPAIFGPLGDDMAVVTSKYTAGELEVIADFLARAREVLVANTSRVERKFGAHRN